MRYDVIIIGSGLGGLECANILSRQGLSVLVLERQLQPGGCMQSYKRRGVAYDTGLHYVGGIDEGQSLHTAFKYLGLLNLPWKQLDEQAFDKVTFLDNGNGETETFHFAKGYDSFVNTLAERFPKERKPLQGYADLLRRADEEQLTALMSPVPPEKSLTNQLFSTNAWEWLHEKFSDDLLINVLSGTALKMELHKETLPLFTFAHGNSGFIQSSWRLEGDGNILVRHLVDGLRSSGGEVVCNVEVKELVEKNGKIAYALCSNGECYEASMFISNIHPALTCALVKESSLMKGIYRKRMARLENTFGMFTVSLRLKVDALPYFNHNKYVYERPNVWELSEQKHNGNGILISCPTSGNQIDILTPMLWLECEQWKDTTIGHRGEDYKEFKENKANTCILLAENVIPGLRGMIEDAYTSTPLTYRDYNHTPEGCAYGIRKDCNMPMMTVLTPRTPIPNLLMTGQNLMLHGLHGVTMTALFTCAEVIGREQIKNIITT